MGLFKKKFRSIKKLPTWIFWFPAMLLAFIKTFLLRTTVNDPNDYINHEDGLITVTWHNRLLFYPLMFPRKTRSRSRAVVSASRDGQYIVDLLHHWGLTSLRGSSSRHGARAQHGAFKALEAGHHVSFTPDGPRGPKYILSRGPIHLASRTGHTILPINVNCSSYWEIPSWDGFQIPKPFSKLELVFGEAIKIPPDLDAEGIEKWRKIVEDKLNEITIDKKS
jgi:lysophospholipid acyltransferase (LPLAT)-like uncharacterized protein